MRSMRVRRGLSPCGLNLPRRVQLQIDWSDRTKDNEFRMLHGGIGYVFCHALLVLCSFWVFWGAVDD